MKKAKHFSADFNILLRVN